MDSGQYRVGKKLGEMERIHLHQCTLPDGNTGILKLALDAVGDGLLDREAVILKAMEKEAKQLERAFDGAKTDPNRYLNYDLCFPCLAQSFKAEERGGRRVNIVNFLAVPDDLSRLVPLEHFRTRARVRVDLRTSAWIMGKLLKIIAFAHNQGIAVRQVTGKNILIEKNQHYVIVFDWTEAQDNFDGPIPSGLVGEEISQAAQEVILALGGNPDTRELPGDPQFENGRYADCLYDLATGNAGDAFATHEAFYQLIRSLWPREFYPFTTYVLD